jgi:hypothetical protein
VLTTDLLPIYSVTLVVTAIAWFVIYHGTKTAQPRLRSCFRQIGLLRLVLSYSLTPFITPLLVLMYWRTHGPLDSRWGVVPDFWVFDFVMTFGLATPLVVLFDSVRLEWLSSLSGRRRPFGWGLSGMFLAETKYLGVMAFFTFAGILSGFFFRAVLFGFRRQRL